MKGSADRFILMCIGLYMALIAIVKIVAALVACAVLILPPFIVVGLLAEVFGRYLSPLWDKCFGWVPDWVWFWVLFIGGMIAMPFCFIAVFALLFGAFTETLSPVPVIAISTALSVAFFSAIHIGEGPEWSTWAWLKGKFSAKEKTFPREPAPFGYAPPATGDDLEKAGLV